MRKNARASSRAAARTRYTISNREVGRRLLVLRASFGLSGKTAAAIAGYARPKSPGKNVWAALEAGKMQILPEPAVNICYRFGLSVDWLYTGNIACLSDKALQKLREGERNLAEARADGRRWRWQAPSSPPAKPAARLTA